MVDIAVAAIGALVGLIGVFNAILSIFSKDNMKIAKKIRKELR